MSTRRGDARVLYATGVLGLGTDEVAEVMGAARATVRG